MEQGYSILTQIEVSNPGLQYVENDKKKDLHPNQMLGLAVPFVKEYVDIIKVRMFDKHMLQIYYVLEFFLLSNSYSQIFLLASWCCKAMKDYGIRSGISFGSAPKSVRDTWKQKRCDSDKDVAGGTCKRGKLVLS